MSHQTTQPPTHPKEVDWPKRILLGFGVLILLTALSLLIYAGVKGGGTTYDNANDNGEGVNENGNQGIAIREPNPNGYDCTADKYNCENFSTQSEAQVAFDFCLNSGTGDVWGLDSDGDSIVCESLN